MEKMKQIYHYNKKSVRETNRPPKSIDKLWSRKMWHCPRVLRVHTDLVNHTHLNGRGLGPLVTMDYLYTAVAITEAFTAEILRCRYVPAAITNGAFIAEILMCHNRSTFYDAVHEEDLRIVFPAYSPLEIIAEEGDLEVMINRKSRY